MNTTSPGSSTGVYAAPATIDEALIGDKVGATKNTDSSFVRCLFKALLETTKASNALPTGDDAAYACTYPAFKKEVEQSSRDVLKLLFELLSQVSEEGVPSTSLLLSSEMHSLEEIDPELFECISDVVDGLLVDVEIRLEEAKGTKRRQQSLNVLSTLSRSSSDIPKPQEKFTERLDNARAERVKQKTGAEEEHEAHLGMFSYRDWQLKPPDEELSSLHIPPHIPDPPHFVLSNIEAMFVNTEEGLDALLEEFEKESQMEIAIDLENHSFRSFQGICCLMQITTSSGDYIIDTLALRSALPRLRAPFGNSSIVKVMHGCNSDILWLQRDFGLYLVNVFDTGQASRELGLPSFGLSHLLSTYCDVHISKAHQLSDWRLRPLSDSMLRYAQRDTHYLLYLHGVLRKKLWDRGGQEAILRVLDASKELCRQRYRVPQFDPDGWLKAMYRQPMTHDLTSIGRRVIARLWEWRDRIAREADESVGYVISLQLMIRIARSLPLSSDGLYRCGNPLPPLIREKSSEVLRIVSECAEMGDHNVVKNQALDSQQQQQQPSDFMQDSTAVMTGSYGSDNTHRSSSEMTALETEELYRMAGWNSPIPSTEHGGDKSKLRLSAGNAGMDASLEMPHSLVLREEDEISEDRDYVDKDHEKAQQIRDEIANEPILSLQNAPDLVSLDEIICSSTDMKGEQSKGGVGEVVVEGHHADREEGQQPPEKSPDVQVIPKHTTETYRTSNRDCRSKDEKGVEQFEQLHYFCGCKNQKCGDTTIREFTSTSSSPMEGSSSRASSQQPQPRASSLYEDSSGSTTACIGAYPPNFQQLYHKRQKN